MQMSVFLALVQTLIGAATLGVALLALDSGDPPHSDGSPSNQSEDWAPSPPGRPCGVPAIRGQVL